MNLFKKQAKGFTLIELLVVIAIIGILSSVVLASLNTARLKSRDTRRVADVKQLQLALQLYFDAHGNYPATLAALAPTYIAVIPTDPTNQSQYIYDGQDTDGTASTCESYHMGASMEDNTNQALNSDVDVLPANVGTKCNGSGDPFSGRADKCVGTTDLSGTTDNCYDVTP